MIINKTTYKKSMAYAENIFAMDIFELRPYWKEENLWDKYKYITSFIRDINNGKIQDDLKKPEGIMHMVYDDGPVGYMFVFYDAKIINLKGIAEYLEKIGFKDPKPRESDDDREKELRSEREKFFGEKNIPKKINEENVVGENKDRIIVEAYLQLVNEDNIPTNEFENVFLGFMTGIGSMMGIDGIVQIVDSYHFGNDIPYLIVWAMYEEGKWTEQGIIDYFAEYGFKLKSNLD